MIRDAIAHALEHRELDPATMDGAMELILAGGATAAQIAALAIALRMKGETASELATAARALRRHATKVAAPEGVLLDTCGTGGDGAGTINVSTLAAVVVAACGVRVAKHGNRAVSSQCGSADVLERLGVRTDVAPAQLGRLIAEVGLAFLFAPAHHPALRFAAPVRRELGVRTFFNLLGPLANPAGATHQLLGVYDRARVRQLAEVLALLGTRSAWVVSGSGPRGVGVLDEISPFGPTHVAALGEDGSVREYELTPAAFGFELAPSEALGGGDAAHNAALARRILDGEALPARSAVLLNAAAALVVAGAVATPREGALRAAQALDTGAARAKLAEVVDFLSRAHADDRYTQQDEPRGEGG